MKGNFLVEVDGVAAVRASEVKMAGPEHEESELWEGGRNNPHVMPGTFKVPAIEIKQAELLGNAGEAFYALCRNFLDGIDRSRTNIRVIQLDENNQTKAIDEYIDCVPKKFTPDDKDAKSNDQAMYTISFRPEDHNRVY